MEIKYKLLSLILIIVTIILISIKKKKTLNNIILIANTDYIKESNYYKKINIIYKSLKILIIILYIISFILLFLLIGRLSIKDNNTYNNDINICLDVTSNIDETNYNLTNIILNNKKILENSNTTISIFNTTTVTLSPLTNDYNFIMNELSLINKSIKVNNPEIYGPYNKKDYLLLKNYIVSGTTYNYEEKGTSLIGDGLISCLNNYDLSNKHQKILLFSTDNETKGKETYNIEDGYKIAKKYNIKIISIIPQNIKDKNKNSLINISDKILYFNQNNELIKIIKSYKNNKSESTDIPTIPFIILYVSLILIIIIKKVIIWA